MSVLLSLFRAGEWVTDPDVMSPTFPVHRNTLLLLDESFPHQSMSKYGNYLNTAKALVGSVNPAYSSVTEWVDILTSERYSEDSYDAIDELLEAIRVQGFDGIAESSRAIRKKLKYGNTHRQIRALTVSSLRVSIDGQRWRVILMVVCVFVSLRSTDSAGLV